MDELAKRFADLAERFGPKVVDAALGAARVEAYSTLVSGVVCLAISAMFFGTARWLWQRLKKDNWDEFTIFFVGLFAVFGLLLAVIGFWQIIDPWTWVTMSHPEMWIAKRVLRL